METFGRPCKMYNGQPRPLEITPVQPLVFIVIAVAVGGLFDLRDVPLDADQSDSYTLQAHQQMRFTRTFSSTPSIPSSVSIGGRWSSARCPGAKLKA